MRNFTLKYFRICFFSIAIFFSSSLLAQNLVPNPSFEQYNFCPYTSDMVRLGAVIGWTNYSCTPEYYNSCATWWGVAVPTNGFGYQEASTGNAYCGFYAYQAVSPYNIREYVGGQLSSPLIIGTKYYVSFKVNLALDSATDANSAVNNLGVLFSSALYSDSSSSVCNSTFMKNFAHVFSLSVITDTLNWTTVSGSFIADSAYQYIIVGNFFDDANTTVTPLIDTNVVGWSASYYFIDDVCVSTDSLTCNGTNGIQNFLPQNNFNIYPNPASDNTILYLPPATNNLIVEVTLVDTYGKKILSNQSKIQNNKIIFRRPDQVSPGLYFMTININGNTLTQKIIFY